MTLDELATIRAFQQLRWGAFTGLFLILLTSILLLDLPASALPFAVVLLTVAASNLAVLPLVRRGVREEPVLGTVILLDVALLTYLLSSYGGYANPFSMLYIVHVLLAAFFLGTRWTWITFALSAASFLLLFFWYEPLAPSMTHHDHSSAGVFDLHLHGMLTAFLLIGLLTALCVTKMSTELAALRSQQATHDKLTALAALAAGTAHELATPLATISLISETLKDRGGSSEPMSTYQEDLVELHKETLRAREVITRMRARSPELHGEGVSTVELRTVLDNVVARVASPHLIDLEIDVDPSRNLKGVQLSLEEALFVLLKNALEESGPHAKNVQLSVEQLQGGLRFNVRDFGRGVSDDILKRLGEPFFTTKPPGEGMGLGLYLVQTFASHVGGSLQFSPMQPGLLVSLTIPS